MSGKRSVSELDESLPERGPPSGSRSAAPAVGRSIKPSREAGPLRQERDRTRADKKVGELDIDDMETIISHLSDEAVIQFSKWFLLEDVHIEGEPIQSTNIREWTQRTVANIAKNDLRSELLPEFFNVLDSWQDLKSKRHLYAMLVIILRLSRRIGVNDPEIASKQKMKDLDMRLIRIKRSKAACERQQLMQPFVEKAAAKFSALPAKKLRHEVKKYLLSDPQFIEVFPKKNFNDRNTKADIDAIIESIVEPPKPKIAGDDDFGWRVVHSGNGKVEIIREPGVW